jgi:predicted porin
MKKTIFSLALATLAGAAAAQSSVTLFGVLDMGLMRGTGSVSDKTQLASSIANSSRLGFRGVEDLGGGLSAGFWLEAGISPDTGLGGATSTNNQASGTAAGPAGTQGLVFARRSTLSLTGNWGELRLGRDLTPQAVNHIVFDPFDNKGVGGSSAYFGYAALHPAPGPHTRASNTIAYHLPQKLGGFYGTAMHYLGENNSGAANSRDGTGTAIRFGYGKGPFTVALATAKTRYVAGDVKTTNIGGSYTFGTVTLTGTYDRTTAGAVAGKGALIAAVVKVPTGDVRGSYTVFENDRAGTPKSRRLAIGYRHNLSKRTYLYADVARVNNSGGAREAIGAAVTAANESSSGVAFGIRHSF